MKKAGIIEIAVLTAFVTLQAKQGAAEEQVNIPKARLQELERKEKELEELKAETEQLRKAKKVSETKAAKVVAANERTEAAIAHDTPPLASLAPWSKADVVDAMDLMAHYRTDRPAAARRYEAQRIRVQGEIVGFEKQPFVRPYTIFLRTTERRWKVICRINPPEGISAVFTAKQGEELMGSSGGSRARLARLGQKAIIEGSCKGLKEGGVTLAACKLVSVE